MTQKISFYNIPQDKVDEYRAKTNYLIERGYVENLDVDILAKTIKK